MEEYKIAEFNETFTILKKDTEKYYDYPYDPFPFFGKLKERISWKNVDIQGNVMHSWMAVVVCEPFKSLEEARAKIKIWRKGTIYHNEVK